SRTAQSPVGGRCCRGGSSVVNPTLAGQLKDWLQFFRDIGFEDFYHRPARLVEQSAQMDASSGSGSAHRAAPAPEPVRNSPARLQPEPLSLFEAAPARTRERETLEDIRNDLGECQRCKLSKGRKHIVFGQGNPQAQVVFVGEGPGADEDEQGLPFVGRAGQLLNRMLQLIQIKREDVYICNVVKCRPPGNRTPESDEIAACSPFLLRQIEAIHPRLICCLGAPAARTVLGIKESITKVHGRFFDYAGTKAMATVHPAYVLRSPREETILREDFEKISEFLKSV
ncbi:MAG: uracil-DNA glycosylase, partial [Terriglobia bacterium]